MSRSILLGVALWLCVSFPSIVGAQTLLQDTVTTIKARVVEVVSSENRFIPGTETLTTYQTLTVVLLEGPLSGERLTVDNDYLTLEVGDLFYLRHSIDGTNGRETYAVSEPYRLPALLWLLGLFLLCLFLFGGKQGIRGLFALIASFFCIVYFLLPGIMAGYPPVLIALGVSALIIVSGSYITHGLNRSTSAAVIGMLCTIAITGLLAYLSIHGAKLSGYSSDESVYLNFSTNGGIDFVGLLLGALLIGLLGVLYDAAISQAIAVEELASVGPELTRQELFKRGLRIGREHIGALVNTLAIAYVGVSLPLLLLLTTIKEQSLLITINQELFATELVRMMIGSIGIILAVPITTAVAVWMLHGKKYAPRQNGGQGHHH